MNVDQVLHLLAKKKNPDIYFASDCHWVDHNPEDGNVYCLICNYNFGDIGLIIFTDFSEIIIEHGKIHLKERNLLVFI